MYTWLYVFVYIMDMHQQANKETTAKRAKPVISENQMAQVQSVWFNK